MSVKPQPGKYRPSEAKTTYFTGIIARDIANTPEFLTACEKNNVKPSIRQARDFRRKLGHFAK